MEKGRRKGEQGDEEMRDFISGNVSWVSVLSSKLV